MNDAMYDIATLQQAVRHLPHDELASWRKKAAASFARRGFPTVRDEDWKYTDLSKVEAISQQALLSEAAEPGADSALAEQVKTKIAASWIVIANGRVHKGLSTGLDQAGVKLSPLGQSTLKFDDPLADLNLALLKEGIHLDFSKDWSSDQPLGLMILDASAPPGVATQVRVDITVAAGARARIVEMHVSSGDGEHYSNCLINLALADNASCDYVRIQDRSLQHSQTARLNAILARDSHLRHCGFDLGGRLTRNDLKVSLNGEHASAIFDGLYICADGQHVDNHTRADHIVGPAASAQEYRGVLSGKCQAVWNGKAIVYKGADGTDANQANHNLLLTEQAEINAKPELEIYADEVKCAHGTTVGQLDESALFYLRTRGIERLRAERILTRAFAATIVNKSPIAELHDYLGNKVEQRLRHIDGEPAQ